MSENDDFTLFDSKEELLQDSPEEYSVILKFAKEGIQIKEEVVNGVLGSDQTQNLSEELSATDFGSDLNGNEAATEVLLDLSDGYQRQVIPVSMDLGNLYSVHDQIEIPTDQTIDCLLDANLIEQWIESGNPDMEVLLSVDDVIMPFDVPNLLDVNDLNGNIWNPDIQETTTITTPSPWTTTDSNEQPIQQCGHFYTQESMEGVDNSAEQYFVTDFPATSGADGYSFQNADGLGTLVGLCNCVVKYESPPVQPAGSGMFPFMQASSSKTQSAECLGENNQNQSNSENRGKVEILKLILDPNGMQQTNHCNCKKPKRLLLLCPCLKFGTLCYICNCMNCCNNLTDDEDRKRVKY